MKHLYLVVFFLLLALAFARAQAISINTDASSPDPSAILDVKSTDKGMLVPRMSTMQRTLVAAPATGLLVFDTNTQSFWFYNGAAWTNLISGSTPAAFIADTDGNTKAQTEANPNEDIIRFDLGGTESMVLQKNAGGSPRLELPNGLNNTFVGTSAGSANTTGRHNVANGAYALFFNTTGNYNVANGAEALYRNTTGSGNTANGPGALVSNTAGGGNTAIGISALISNTIGFNNTAIGISALYSNTTGNYNTAVGDGADVSSGTLHNATALGYKAKVGCSNCLVLGATGNDAVNVGIGTASPGQNLDVRSAGPDLPAIFVLGNSDLSHQLGFFPGRQNDPNPFIQWKDGDPLRFVTDAGGFSEKMRITSDGKAGIGTDTPQSQIEVKIPFSTTDTSNGIQLNAGERRWRMTVGGDKTGNAAYFQLLFKNQANPYAPFLTVSSTGNLGVGRVPGTNRLEVEGEASKTTAGSWVGNSDARLKKNITPLDSRDMLQRLLALQGVTFEWNDDKTGSKRPEGIQYGFTAQNIRTVFPTLVEKDKLGYLQTAYGTYDAMTVEAIRALNDKITALEAENAGQKALIEVQKKQLEIQSARLDAQSTLLQQITVALQTAGISVESR